VVVGITPQFQAPVGLEEGNAVLGIELGVSLGLSLGALLGALVEGDMLGTSLGEPDGSSDGCHDGLTLGALEGRGVGGCGERKNAKEKTKTMSNLIN